jgi:hypothetical protein
VGGEREVLTSRDSRFRKKSGINEASKQDSDVGVTNIISRVDPRASDILRPVELPKQLAELTRISRWLKSCLNILWLLTVAPDREEETEQQQQQQK